MKHLRIVFVFLVACMGGIVGADTPGWLASSDIFKTDSVDSGYYGNMLLSEEAAKGLEVYRGERQITKPSESQEKSTVFVWGTQADGLNLADQTLSGWFLVDDQGSFEENRAFFSLYLANGNESMAATQTYRIFTDKEGRVHITNGASDSVIVTKQSFFRPGQWVHLTVILGETVDGVVQDTRISAAIYINGQRAETEGAFLNRKTNGSRFSHFKIASPGIYSAGIDIRPDVVTPDRIPELARCVPSFLGSANLIRFIMFNNADAFYNGLHPEDSEDLTQVSYRPVKGRHGAALGQGSSFTVSGKLQEELVPPTGPWSMTLRFKVSDDGWLRLRRTITGANTVNEEAKTLLACGAYPFIQPTGFDYAATQGGWHLRANQDRSISLDFFSGQPNDSVLRTLTIPNAFDTFGDWVQVVLTRTGTENGKYRLYAIPDDGKMQSVESEACLAPLKYAALKGELSVQDGLSGEQDTLEDLSFWRAALPDSDVARLNGVMWRVLVVYSPDELNINVHQVTQSMEDVFQSLSKASVSISYLGLSPGVRPAREAFDANRLQHVLNGLPFDAVVGIGCESSGFLKAYEGLLPSDTASVFARVQGEDEKDTQELSPGLRRMSTGIYFESSLSASMAQAQLLWPEVQRFFVIVPYPQVKTIFSVACPHGSSETLPVTTISRFNASEEKLLSTVEALPPSTVVVFGAWNDRKPGRPLQEDMELVKKLAAATENPVLVLNGRFVGLAGATGSFYICSVHSGSILGDILVRIFEGVSPSNIPPTQIPVFVVFDRKALSGVKMKTFLDELPAATRFMNEQFEIQNYLRELIFIIGFVIFLLLVMFVFTWSNIRRRIRTQTLLEELPVDILMISPEDRVILNPADSRSKAQASLSALDSRIRTALEAAIAGVRKTGKPYVTEFTNTNGHHMRGVCSPLPEKAYQSGMLLWVATDVHELYNAKMEALNSSALLHSVANNLPGFLFVKDADNDFRYVMSNKAFAGGLNQTPESIIGKDDFLIFARHEEAAACRRGDERALLIGGVNESQETFHLADGTRVSAQIFKQTVRMGNGHRYVLGMGTDISRMVEMENTLRLHVEQEQRINANLQTVVSGADQEEVFNAVLTSLGSQRGVYHSGLFYFTPDRNHFYCEAGWNPRGAPLSNREARYPIEPDNTWVKELLDDKIVTFTLDDTTSYSPLAKLPHFVEVLRTAGVDSISLIAVKSEGSLLGFLGFACKSEIVNQASITHFIRSSAHVLELFFSRQRAEQQIHRSESDKRMILDTVQIPVLLFDDKLRLVHLNSAASTFAAELIKQKAVKDMPQIEPPAAAALRTGEPAESNMTLGGRDYQVKAIPVVVDGQIVNIVETAYDVTTFNEAQRSLEKAMEATQAAAKAKSFFIATISHELRTPLNAVIGFSELMQNVAMSGEERKNNLEAINIAGKTLLTLINDILDLSRLESEQVEIVKAPMDLVRMINELKLVFKAACLKKGLTFEVEVPEKLPFFLLDQIRIRQVLFNIVGNAVKFTLKGGVIVRILCDYTDAQETVANIRIIVADTGPGIEPQFQKNIFEPFGQKNHVRGNTVYEGSGLGLSITRRLLTCMDGEVSLESKVGVGSTFTITLNHVACVPPQEETPLIAVSEPTENPAGLSFKLPESTVSEVVRDIPKATVSDDSSGAILIVDDVAMNLKVLGAMLTRMNRGYISATSGEEAFDLAVKMKPSLILTDLWMPGMNGDELARRLRDHAATDKIPVYAITADTQFDLTDSPFVEVLYKPITLDKLRPVIEKY